MANPKLQGECSLKKVDSYCIQGFVYKALSYTRLYLVLNMKEKIIKKSGPFTK